MNRVIKFRAFVRGYMAHVASMDFVNEYVTWDDNQYDRCDPPNKCLEVESFEEIKLMQFTGCKDKNEVEVYEGDIVKNNKRTFQEEDDEEPIYDNTISTIIYRGSGFWVADESFGWEGESLWDWNEMEVIGNIYEHPQLLKQ